MFAQKTLDVKSIRISKNNKRVVRPTLFPFPKTTAQLSRDKVQQIPSQRLSDVIVESAT